MFFALRLSRPNRPRLLAALLASAIGLLAAPVASAAAAEDVLTPVVANVVATPEPVLGSDGRQHLAYELQLVNRGSAEIDVKSIRALAGGKVVRSLAGKSVEAVMVPYGEPKLSTKLGPGQAAFVMMDVSFAGKARLPRRLVHRLVITEKTRAAPPTRSTT